MHRKHQLLSKEEIDKNKLFLYCRGLPYAIEIHSLLKKQHHIVMEKYATGA
jgi:hypothetical protein